MADQFSSTMFIQNQWGNTLQHAWLYHLSVGEGAETLSVSSLDSGATSQGQSISFFDGAHDLWTLTFVDQNGQVWGSDANVNDALPNKNVTAVVVTVQGGSNPLMIIDIAGKGSESHPLTRRA